MLKYKVFDYYEGAKLIGTANSYEEAARIQSDQILDTDGECACAIEITGSDGTVYTREPDGNRHGLSLAAFRAKHPSLKLAVYAQQETDDAVYTKRVYKDQPEQTDKRKERFNAVAEKVIDDIQLEYDPEYLEITAKVWLLPEREAT